MEENSGSAEKKANRDIAEVAIEAAYRKLQSEESLAWVNESGLKLRAFLWGIYAAVEPFADEQQLNGLILRVARDTLFQRDGDRPIEAAFEKSSTGKALKQLEGVCADSASSLQQIEQAIEAMRQAVSTERNFSMMIFDSISERLTHLRRESARQTPEMDPRTAAALACQRRMTMLKELREPLLACCALSKRSGVE
jgi:hypothetical protein